MALTFLTGDIVANTERGDNYFRPDIAAVGDGRYVVVWQGDGLVSPAYDGIYGQIFTQDGVAFGQELLLYDPASATRVTEFPIVEEIAEGGFVVAAQFGRDGATMGHYTSDGTQLPAFGTNQTGWFTVSLQQDFATPALAALSNGSVVVGASVGAGDSFQDQDAWQGYYHDFRDVTSDYPEDGRTWLGGSPLSWSRINTDTPSPVEINQRDMQMTGLSGGNYVAVWVERDVPPFGGRDNAPTTLRGRIFEPLTHPATEASGVGPSFEIAGAGDLFRFVPKVAALPDGGFVVVWQVAGDPTDASTGIRARIFDAAGAATSGILQVNQTTAGAQSDPDVAVFDDGRFVVVWEGQDRSLSGIWGREFAADGTPLGDETRLNDDQSFAQIDPSVATIGNDRLVVAWSDLGATSEFTQVVTRVFTTDTAAPPTDDILGTAGGDLLSGTAAAERIFGLGGNDTIRPGGGNDTLDGGGGLDLLDLATMTAPVRTDLSLGQVTVAGDTLSVSSIERVTSGSGNDTLIGSNASDTLAGGAGDDVITGGTSSGDLRDLVFGGDGNDTIEGSAGNDELRGDAGNDDIAGGAGADTVIGGAGDDVMTGSAFGDVIFGGDGFDFINGGFGSDRLNGGNDADRFFHVGVAGHGSDWIQDYDASEGDVLLYGGSATIDQFQVNRANTANAGDSAVDEAFVIYKPTGQILWALVDGFGNDAINLRIAGQDFDLLG